MSDQQAFNTVIAVVWEAAALIGAAYTLARLRDARRSQRAVYRLNGPETEQAALDLVRDEQLRLLAQLVMVVAGLFVLAPINVDDRATFVRLLLVSVPVILMVKSIRGKRASDRIVSLASSYSASQQRIENGIGRLEQAGEAIRQRGEDTGTVADSYGPKDPA